MIRHSLPQKLQLAEFMAKWSPAIDDRLVTMKGVLAEAQREFDFPVHMSHLQHLRRARSNVDKYVLPEAPDLSKFVEKQWVFVKLFHIQQGMGDLRATLSGALKQMDDLSTAIDSIRMELHQRQDND